MKKTLISMLAVVMLLTAATRCPAQDTPQAGMKPVVVVSLGGYDAIYGDLEFLGQTAGAPELGKMAEGFLALFTQGQGLAGLDKTKPLGLAASTDGLQFQAYAFVPVTDLQKLLGALAGMIGQAKDTGDGIWEISLNNNSAFVKEKNGWAFVAQSPENLANLPDDPVAMLAGLNTTYDIAVRVNVQNIPQVFRQMAVDQLKMGVAMGTQRQPEETDDQFQLRRKLIDRQSAAFVDIIQQLDQLTVGWSIDGQGKRAFLDFGMVAVDGSSVAEKIAAMAGSESKFAGFASPDALFSAHANTVAGKEDTESTLVMFEALREKVMQEIAAAENLKDPQVKDLVEGLVKEILEVGSETIKAGRVNAGAAVFGKGPYTVVTGGFVADGKKLETVAKKVIALVKEDVPLPDVQWSTDTHGDVTFHTASMPMPEMPDASDRENAVKVLGETLEITAGFGTESVFLAVGSGSVGAIKKVIDDSQGSASGLPPVQISLAIGPLVQLAAEQENANPITLMLAQMLQGSGKDHLKLTANQITNGLLYRIEVEEDILKLMGSAAKMGAAMGAGGPPGGAF